MVAAAQEIQRSWSRQKAEEAGNFSSFLPMATGDLLQCHRNGAANLPSTAARVKTGSDAGGKGTLLHYWWECKVIQPLRRTVWRCLKKLGIKLPYDPAIPLVGKYPKKTIIQKDTCTPMFIVHTSTYSN